MTAFSMILLCWMSCTVAVVWLLPGYLQIYSMMLSTVLFLAYFSPPSLVMLLFIAAGYKAFCERKMRLHIVLGAVVTAIVFLVWFKTGNRISASGISVAVPIGFSYYALRVIHYFIDRYKGTIPSHSFHDFAAYLFFLPTLTSGPINRFQEFQRSLQRRRWDNKLFSRGCERMLYGLAKIVILGNYLVSLKLVQLIYSIDQSHSSLREYLDCIRYGLNLFFQFSGYSDIAIGFSLLLGFRISENFNYPFSAININDFWKRWHISLSEWCRDYIFMPVLSVFRRPLVAIFSSMLVLGLWHEFSGRYIAWGIYHGAGIAVWHLFQKSKARLPFARILAGSTAAKAFSWIMTVNFVLLSFAITKEPDLRSAAEVYHKIFMPWS